MGSSLPPIHFCLEYREVAAIIVHAGLHPQFAEQEPLSNHLRSDNITSVDRVGSSIRQRILAYSRFYIFPGVGPAVQAIDNN